MMIGRDVKKLLFCKTFIYVSTDHHTSVPRALQIRPTNLFKVVGTKLNDQFGSYFFLAYFVIHPLLITRILVGKKHARGVNFYDPL